MIKHCTLRVAIDVRVFEQANTFAYADELETIRQAIVMALGRIENPGRVDVGIVKVREVGRISS